MGSKKASKKVVTGMTFDLGAVKANEWTDLPSGEFGETFPEESTKAGTTIEGRIIDFRESVGKNDKDLFVIKTAKKDYTLWSSAALSRLFSLGIKAVGLQVRVTYDGTKKLTGKKQPMKLFKVAIRK